MREIILFLFVGFSLGLNAQTKRDYVYQYAEIAVQEMEEYNIPASIKLAQGILESRFGQSDLSSRSNNHFGIKCHSGWTGMRTYHDDDEKGECFRVYQHARESFRDHSEFLATRRRYQDLFSLSTQDYKGWAKGLRKAGYATNPQYANILIRIIEEEELYVFDRMKSEDVRPYIAELRHVDYIPSKPVDFEAPKPNGKVTIGGPAASEEGFTTAIFSTNDVQTIFFQPNDSPSSISARTGVSIKRLKKYNEWDQYYSEVQPGTFVFLQPKRSKTRNVRQLFHTVQMGETMYQIAQKYGIKTEKLYKLNQLSVPQQPHPGEMISLRKKRDTSPKILNKKELLRAEEERAILEEKQKLESNKEKVKEEVSEQTMNPQVISEQPQAPIVLNPKQGSEVTPTETVQEESTVSPPSQTIESEEIISVETTNPFGEASKNEDNQITNEEEVYEGRAIIYDSTPEVNQKPVEVYSPPSSKPVAETNQQSIAQVTYHKVVRGDTLYGLSRKYGVSVGQIKSWNKMTDTNIKVGQKLIVGK